MMTRRYDSAINVFQLILQYYERVRREGLNIATTYQTQATSKTVEKIRDLLTLCLLIHPTQNLDEAIKSQLSEKNSEVVNRWHSLDLEGQLKEAQKLFQPNAPKAVFPCSQIHRVGGLTNNNRDATNHQLAVFLQEFREHHQLATVKE